MSSLENVKSPPYPDEAASPDSVLVTMRLLRKWVLIHRDEYNKRLGQDVLPAVRAAPTQAAYLAQPTAAVFSHMLYMRRLREQWDHLVRVYERDWDADACFRQRVVLLGAAALLLNEAAVPGEHREARKQKALAATSQALAEVATLVDACFEKKTHDPEIA